MNTFEMLKQQKYLHFFNCIHENHWLPLIAYENGYLLRAQLICSSKRRLELIGKHGNRAPV